MRKLGVLLVLLFPLLLTCDADAKTKEHKETAHYDVVSEYVRSLGAMYDIQQIASREFEADKNNPTQRMLDRISSATRYNLELSSSIDVLKGMILNKPFDELIPNTISFYKRKKELFNETAEISRQFIEGVPKPEVDYSKLLARLPEITSEIEYIDKSICQSIVLIFALLIDKKPDSEGHMSHLIITKEQRQKLVDSIDAHFGVSLNKEDKSWIEASAFLLRSYLLKEEYKCRDEW